MKECYGVCLISNRYPNILSAIEDSHNDWMEPRDVHMHCIQHLLSNFNTHYIQLKSYFSKLAYETQKYKFTKGIMWLQCTNSDAYERINALPIEKLSRVHDGGYWWGMMTTNLLASFNILRFACDSIGAVDIFCLFVEYFKNHHLVGINSQANGMLFMPSVITELHRNECTLSLHTSTNFNPRLDVYHVLNGHDPNTKKRGGRVYCVRLNQCICTRHMYLYISHTIEL